MRSLSPARVVFWTAGAVTFAADQLTKWLIYGRILETRDVTIVPGFFYLKASQNTGVVWGLFGRWPAAVGLMGLGAAGLVVFFYYRHAGRSRLEGLAWGIILGGAAGNLLDRAFLGHVRDFLDLTVAGFSWPTFNVADGCISVGAVYLILSYAFARHEEPSESGKVPKKG